MKCADLKEALTSKVSNEDFEVTYTPRTLSSHRLTTHLFTEGEQGVGASVCSLVKSIACVRESVAIGKDVRIGDSSMCESRERLLSVSQQIGRSSFKQMREDGCDQDGEGPSIHFAY